jgi:hypothetical protein
MARTVNLVPVEQPQAAPAGKVTLTPVDAGITRGAGAEAGAPVQQEKFSGRLFQDLIEQASGVLEAATSPVQTVKTLGNIGTGAVIKALEATGRPDIFEPGILPGTIEGGGPPSPSLTSLLGQALSKQFPEAVPTAEAAGGALVEEVGRIARDPIEAFSQKPVSTALSVGAVAAPTLRATGLGRLNVLGRAVTKPRRAAGQALERKTTNITRRLAGDLGVSPQAIDVVRANSPDFQSAVTSQFDDLVLLQRAQDAAQEARGAINTEFRGRLQALGIDDPIDLRIARAEIDKKLEGFGITRAPDGELKTGKLRGGLTSGEQTKLREWVESNVDDQIAQNPVITLDDAERFRQERIRNTRPIMETKAGDRAVNSIVERYNAAIDVQKPGFKDIAKDFAPRFDRLEKDLQELGIAGRGKEGTKINSLLQAAKKGEDSKVRALGRIETLSGTNISDMLVGRQIARTLDKPTRTAQGLKNRLTQFVTEFGETPADIAATLGKPPSRVKQSVASARETLRQSVARGEQATSPLIQSIARGANLPLSRVAQLDPGGITEAALVNLLRGVTGTEQERAAR